MAVVIKIKVTFMMFNESGPSHHDILPKAKREASESKEARPRRKDILPRVMRVASETKLAEYLFPLPLRAKWMADKLHVDKHLMPSMRIGADNLPADEAMEKTAAMRKLMKQFFGDDASADLAFDGDPNQVEVVKSPGMLFIGAGKGHEAVEAMKRFAESYITALDPHDYASKKVEKVFQENAPRMNYLPETVRAENLQGIEDNSQDAVTLNFVFHHIDENQHEQVMSEINRVLRAGGFLFVAEDLVDDEQERKKVVGWDRFLNWEVLKKAPHNYRNVAEWTEFFNKNGFKLVEVNETQSKSGVRHGFFVLQKVENKDNAIRRGNGY